MAAILADNIFKWISLTEHGRILIQISLKFVSKSPALVQVLAWRLVGAKPLSEPIMVRLPTHICITQPQWVKFLQLIWRWSTYRFQVWAWSSDKLQWLDIQERAPDSSSSCGRQSDMPYLVVCGMSGAYSDIINLMYHDVCNTCVSY